MPFSFCRFAIRQNKVVKNSFFVQWIAPEVTHARRNEAADRCIEEIAIQIFASLRE